MYKQLTNQHHKDNVLKNSNEIFFKYKLFDTTSEFALLKKSRRQLYHIKHIPWVPIMLEIILLERNLLVRCRLQTYFIISVICRIHMQSMR